MLLICNTTALELEATSLLSQCESLRIWRSADMCTAYLLAVTPLPREAEREESRCVTETIQLFVTSGSHMH